MILWHIREEYRIEKKKFLRLRKTNPINFLIVCIIHHTTFYSETGVFGNILYAGVKARSELMSTYYIALHSLSSFGVLIEIYQ